APSRLRVVRRPGGARPRGRADTQSRSGWWGHLRGRRPVDRARPDSRCGSRSRAERRNLPNLLRRQYRDSRSSGVVMVPKLLLFILADLWMIAAGFIFGWKLLKTRNYLLGIEWVIMGTSGTNFLLFTFTQFQPLFTVAYFFDAFSRAFGFTVI